MSYLFFTVINYVTNQNIRRWFDVRKRFCGNCNVNGDCLSVILSCRAVCVFSLLLLFISPVRPFLLAVVGMFQMSCVSVKPLRCRTKTNIVWRFSTT